MKIEFELEGLLQQAIENALSPEAIRPVIQKKMDELVASAINEQFRYRAPFKELVEQAMASAMPTTLEDLGRFGDLVQKTVAQHLNDVQNDFIQQAMAPRLAELFTPVEKQITLSELCERLTRAFENGFYGDVTAHAPTFNVKKSHTLEGYFDLYADSKYGKENYECGIAMNFCSEGKCYSAKIDQKDVKTQKFIGPTYNAEALVLALYTGMTTVLYQEDFNPEAYSYNSDD